MKKNVLVSLLLISALWGCGDEGDDTTSVEDPSTTASANATLEPTEGNTVMGTAKFTEKDGRVSVRVEVTDAPPGMHGLHIHQGGSCGNNAMDAKGHWDGAAEGDPADHGLHDAATSHLGDLGNIEVDEDGTGSLTVSGDWTIGDGAETDVVGHAIVFHAAEDDGTMPSAGARLGCGVITKE
jgi:Cu-Zn family superoxide dismutase